MTLEELSVVTQQPLRASFYSKGDRKWYLFLEGATIEEEGWASTYGVGDSFEEARAMYVDRLRGKTVCFGKVKTPYGVPETLH